MLKILDNNKEWNIIIEGIEYNFYYSEAKPIEGLILNGFDKQLEEYQINDVIISAEKENNRYLLNIMNL